jgi:hypothetical protein
MGMQPISKFLQMPALRNSLNRRLFETAKFGPTIFPILFSAVISRTLGSVARWKAERGTTLEVNLKSREKREILPASFANFMSFF